MSKFCKSFDKIVNHSIVKYSNGKWSVPKLIEGNNMTIPITSSGLHYGQSCFEGLKAHRNVDNEIMIFKPEHNWTRMCMSSTRLSMPNMEWNTFIDSIKLVLNNNRDQVPDHHSSDSYYIRPLLFGSGPTSAVKPAEDYTFIVYGFPTDSNFYSSLKLVTTPYHRSAEKGTGSVKAAGNYASVMIAHKIAQLQGYDECLYLDSVHNKYIEEIGAANFIAFKDSVMYTPLSGSILPSITKKTLMDYFKRTGKKVIEKPISIDDIKNFDSIIACGTAAGVVPVKSITHNNITTEFMIDNHDLKGYLHETQRSKGYYGHHVMLDDAD